MFDGPDSAWIRRLLLVAWIGISQREGLLRLLGENYAREMNSPITLLLRFKPRSDP